MAQIVVGLLPWSMINHCQSSSKHRQVTVKQQNGSEIFSGSLSIPEAMPAQQSRLLHSQPQPSWQQVLSLQGPWGQAGAQGPAAWVAPCLSSIPRQISAACSARDSHTDTTQATPSYQLYQRKYLLCIEFIQISLHIHLLILKKTLMYCGQCMPSCNCFSSKRW